MKGHGVWIPAFVFGPGRLGGWNRCRTGRPLHWGAPWVMDLALHANATTTPKTRSYIQHSKKAVAELVDELGVSETTIRRWRGRTTVGDRSHRPKRLTTNLSAMEETLVCELRTALQLPLDDIVQVMRRCVNGKLSRSAIHRCLQRHGISQRKKPDRPSGGVFEQATVGFIHFDLKHLPALERRKSYAFVAIDRATRYVYVEIHQRRDAKTSAGFLKRFLEPLPTSRSHPPDRQRRRVHRPLCRRYEEQAARPAFRQSPVRSRLRQPQDRSPPDQAVSTPDQRPRRTLQSTHHRSNRPGTQARQCAAYLSQPCRTRHVPQPVCR